MIEKLQSNPDYVSTTTEADLDKLRSLIRSHRQTTTTLRYYCRSRRQFLRNRRLLRSQERRIEAHRTQVLIGMIWYSDGHVAKVAKVYSIPDKPVEYVIPIMYRKDDSKTPSDNSL